MNRNLVYVSLFLVLIGIGFGIYLLSFLGVLLLIPALLAPTNLPRPKTPAPAQSQPPRRIIPPTPPHPAAPTPEQQSMATPSTYAPMTASTYTPMQYQGYSGPLFPAPMFPALSQMGAPPPPPAQPPVSNQGKEDLLEVVALLAVLRLLSG